MTCFFCYDGGGLDTKKANQSSLFCAQDRTIPIISTFIQFAVIVDITKIIRLLNNIENHQNPENVTKT